MNQTKVVLWQNLVVFIPLDLRKVRLDYWKIQQCFFSAERPIQIQSSIRIITLTDAAYVYKNELIPSKHVCQAKRGSRGYAGYAAAYPLLS